MRALSIVPVLASFAVAMCACSGADPNSFPSGAKDAAPPPFAAPDGGSFGTEAGSFGNPPPAMACNPQALSGFSPKWTPPEAWKQKACTSTQISGFYAACLTPPISAQTCGTFVQANASCATCIQSQDTDATSAAVVWHEKEAYWTVNVAGCIANAMGDPGANGCGAAYSAAISCRQASCNACWAAQGTSATFQQFATCEDQAGSSTCSTYANAVPTACGDIGTSAAGVCMPQSGASAQQAYMQVAPLFCGQ
jgi:hypothetical protein